MLRDSAKAAARSPISGRRGAGNRLGLNGLWLACFVCMCLSMCVCMFECMCLTVCI